MPKICNFFWIYVSYIQAKRELNFMTAGAKVKSMLFFTSDLYGTSK